MILSFKCKDTKILFEENKSQKFQSIAKIALRKLDMLDAAALLDDLRIPPGNRLEALHGDRLGQYSIRINEQFRLCFEWQNNKAQSVEIIDYH